MKKVGKIVLSPFKVIGENKVDFGVWFIFTILAGQLGIIINAITKFYSNHTILESLYLDSSNGSFYTFSIALVASLLGSIFLNFLNSSKNIEYKTVKIFTIIISIFFVFFSGIIYAILQKQNSQTNLSLLYRIDWSQLIFYLASIIIVVYGYGIQKLEFSKNYNEINDPLFSEQSDQRRDEVIEESLNTKDDGNGIKLD